MRWIYLVSASAILALGLACMGGAVDEPDLAKTAPPTPADPPPGTDPSAPADVPSPTAPALEAGTGLCTPAETAYFDCETEGGKRISVCGGPSPADLQYRFGKPGAPELLFPEAAAGGAGRFTVREEAFVRSSGFVTTFENEGVRYQVTSMSGGGCCSEEEAAANNFQGVYVFGAGDELIATVSCAGEATDRLEALRDVTQAQ